MLYLKGQYHLKGMLTNTPPETRSRFEFWLEDANISKYSYSAMYDFNSIKGIPENISNITNSKTTTAQFGTVSVVGSC